MKMVCGSKRENIGLMVSNILSSPEILIEFPRVIFEMIIPPLSGFQYFDLFVIMQKQE